MVDSSSQKNLSSSLRDFIPPAFAEHCTHPNAINVSYKELSQDEKEFTYTLTWRGTVLTPRMVEISSLLAQKIKMAEVVEVPKKDRKKNKKKKCRKNTSATVSPTQQQVISDIEGSRQHQPVVSLSNTKHSLQDLDSDLHKDFNCPRYYYNEANGLKKAPLIALQPADDVSSNRSYFGTSPPRETFLKGGWFNKKKPKSKGLSPSSRKSGRSSYKSDWSSSSGETSCSVASLSPSPYIATTISYPEKDVLVNLTLKKSHNSELLYLEQFFPTSAILHDAVDGILKKTNHCLLLDSSKVPSVIYLGYQQRPLNHHEYFCGTLGELMGTDREVKIMVDMSKK